MIVRKHNPHVAVSHDVLYDPRLSLQAKGLYCCLLTGQISSNVTVGRIPDEINEEADNVRYALIELDECGYIEWDME